MRFHISIEINLRVCCNGMLLWTQETWAPLHVFRVCSSCWYFCLKASLIEIERVDFTNKHLHTLSISVIYAYVKAIFTPPSAVRAGRACRSKDSTRRSYVQKAPSLFGLQEMLVCICSLWLKCFTLQVLLRLMMVCDSWVLLNTLWKTNVEAKHRGLDDDFPFQRGNFRFHVSSQGRRSFYNRKDFADSQYPRGFSLPGVLRKLWPWALQHHKLHHLWCLGEGRVVIPSIPCWYVDLIYNLYTLIYIICGIC